MKCIQIWLCLYIMKNYAQEMIPAVQEWEVTNGNTNCKEHGHRLWPRTVPEQKSGKNYPEEAAEHISPDPEQSTSICQHGILIATFWDGSMYFHRIVTKITAIKTTQWMLELALHEQWTHTSTLLLCPWCRALLFSWFPTLYNLPVQACDRKPHL